MEKGLDPRRQRLFEKWRLPQARRQRGRARNNWVPLSLVGHGIQESRRQWLRVGKRRGIVGLITRVCCLVIRTTKRSKPKAMWKAVYPKGTASNRTQHEEEGKKTVVRSVSSLQTFNYKFHRIPNKENKRHSIFLITYTFSNILLTNNKPYAEYIYSW